MNELKPFNMGNDEGSWRTQSFRQSVVAKIEEAIQRSGMPTSRNSIEMENHVFQKAKSKEEYLSMVARLILHVREINTKKAGMVNTGPNAGPGQIQPGPGMPGGPNPNQSNVSQPPNQVGQSGQSGPGGNQDPINALQNLASQGSRNNLMMGNMGGPQGSGPQGMGPGNQMQGMPNQMGPQGPMGPQQNAPITATNLLQTFNQRPQMANMQLQNKMVPGMGMVPNQGQMGPGNMMNSISQMQGHMGNQMGGPQMGGMQNQMGPNMSVPNAMQNQMVGINTMAGQMVPNQMNPSMAAQMAASGSNQMSIQMANMVPNQLGGQAAQLSMMQHIQQQQQQQQRKPDQMMGTSGGPNQQAGANFPGGPRTQTPGQFLRQSPSPSAPSPAGMGGPSPASMGVMSSSMASPMSVGSMGVGIGPVGGVASPALAPSPSPHHGQHPQHMQHQQRPIGMAPSPGSALNTPLGAGGAAPSPLGSGGMSSGGMAGGIPGDEHAYREKVRQLSKYIEPLRRMISRMVSDGENVEKLTKMMNLLDILSHPSKRMPLETLLKCEVVLEKLDFKRGESNPLHLHGLKEHQIFNPLLEVVNNSLQSPLANHTLKRTFGPCMEALSGPEIRNMPPPLKIVKVEEVQPDIPDVLQGEIARLDSRFKVSLEAMQLTGTSNGGEEGSTGCCGGGAVRLTAHLDDARLPCVPPVQLSVPRDYPASPPSARLRPHGASADASSFPVRVEKALAARLALLPAACSISQLLDAWEMSVRQACAPDESLNYTAVPALGI